MLIEKSGELSKSTKRYVILHGLFKAAAKGNASAAHRLQYWMENAERWQAKKLERNSEMDKAAEEVRAKLAQMGARRRAFYGVPADYAGSATNWFREQLEKLTKARDEQG